MLLCLCSSTLFWIDHLVILSSICNNSRSPRDTNNFCNSLNQSFIILESFNLSITIINTKLTYHKLISHDNITKLSINTFSSPSKTIFKYFLTHENEMQKQTITVCKTNYWSSISSNTHKSKLYVHGSPFDLQFSLCLKTHHTQQNH